MDMLSIRKTRQHGMQDDRWLTKHKIVQYKGLINLYKRDQKISTADENITKRQTKVLLARLKRNMAKSYADLDNALFGDRQKIKNALAVDRPTQLAYQNLPPDVIEEHIEQDNFMYRKKLDLMQYQKLIKSRKLVNLKLEKSVLEDMVIYFQPGSLPIEKKTYLYTALVQDAHLKKDAAIVVNESYKKIIGVMKKDQIYFDQILNSLRQDTKRQANCMLNTIKLGQLAIEYLDDRRSDFIALEKVIQDDVRERKDTLRTARDMQRRLSKSIKLFMKRDSSMDIPLAKQASNVDVQNELTQTCDLLDTLKSAFFVNNYDDLFKYVKSQKVHYERLRKLNDRTLQGRNHLINRTNHASLMYTTMCNTMAEGTQSYQHEKAELLDTINYQQNRRNEAIEECSRSMKVLNAMKISLQQMEQMCKIVDDPKNKPKIKYYTGRNYRKLLYEQLQAEAIDIKEDCSQIIEILERKLTNLIAKADEPITDDRTRSQADKLIQDLIKGRSRSILKSSPKDLGGTTIDEDQFHEDPSIPTRLDIKAMSKEIVQLNTASDEV